VSGVSSFNWNHVPTGTPRSALVFIWTNSGSSNPVTGVTYGGKAMTAIPYTAAVTSAEQGGVNAWFCDEVPSGTQNIVVSRTNNSIVTYATCMTQTAAADKACEVYLAGVKTKAGAVAEATAASSTSNGTSSSWSSMALDDGSPGSNSIRYMAIHSGAASVSTASTNTTTNGTSASIDFGAYVFFTMRETTPSQGSKTLTITTAISDDLAVIGLAVREKTLITGTSAATFKFSEAATGSQTIPAVTGTSAATWKYSTAATGAETISGTSAATWKFSESATGEHISGATGTAASTWKFSAAATGAETMAGSSAATFKYSVATTGTETITGTAASTWKHSTAATGTETISGTAASTWKHSVAATGAEVMTGTSATHWEFNEAASGWTASGYAAAVRTDNPVGYWRFGEANGITAVDEMGNGNGTYVNSPVLGATGALDGDANTAVTFGTP